MLKNYFKLMVAILFVSNVMAQNIPSYLPKDGLVGWWPFNGNANDESGNGNHGTMNGATLTSNRNGEINKAFVFDGVNDYIALNKPYFEGSKSVEEFTYSTWVNCFQIPVSSSVFISAKEGYWRSKYIFIEPDSTIHFGRTQPNPQNYFDINSGNNKLKTNNWVNIVISYNKGKLNLFLDGKIISNVTIPYTSLDYSYLEQGNSTNSNLIGAIYPKTGIEGFFHGKIDDIAIYNRALTQEEIKQLYEGCTKETATSSSFNSVIYTTNTPVNLSANPTGGTFNGEAVTNNVFNPSKAKLGKNQVKYTFKNSTGCADSTNFTMILVDTLGNKCSTYDTLKIKVQLTTGIKAGQLTSMNVYPNPASELLIIEANDIQALGGYKYKILDLQGKEVYNALATAARTEISLKSIGAKGMYILHIVDEKGVSIENKKIVLE